VALSANLPHTLPPLKCVEFIGNVVGKTSNIISASARQYIPISDRRCLTREHAAEYLDVSLSTFDAWVRNGTLPAALPGKRRWDRKAIDLALDKLSGLQSTPDDTEDAFLAWKRGRKVEGQDARG
jgi:excisionase family DNA binding protein